MTAHYWRTISYIDSELGRLLDKMDQLEIDDRTIVVFASDHGWSNGHHARFGKGTLFDQSIRAPLIVSVPWISETHGTTVETPVEQIDVYPTLLELTNLPIEPTLDGESLVSLLRNPDSPHGPVFGIREGSSGATVHRLIRIGDHKFVYWEDGNHVFYDLGDDPGEYENRYGDKDVQTYVDDCLRALKDNGLLEATWNPFRSGYPGTNGVPAFVPRSDPILGSTLELEVTNSSTFAESGVLLTGLHGSRQETNLGGSLLVRPLSTFAVPILSETLVLATGIPNDLSLQGLSVVMQWIQSDPGARYGASFSKGLRLFLWPE